LVGHSERRQYFNEDDALLADKVAIALENGLVPIFCCGESLDQRQSQDFLAIVKAQITASLFTLSAEDFGKVVIAYEPIWAIGTGLTATSAQAQEMHAELRSHIAAHYGAAVADNTSILYGGSCNDKNADELFACPDVDGGLIGGASLKAKDFMAIVKARGVTIQY
jgi:triosephosphate isomerase